LLTGCEAQARLIELKDSEGNAIRFIENARKYTEITELTSEILHTFIQRVEVGERAERYSRTAPQEIRIYYSDIGIVDDIPETMDISELYEEYPDDVAGAKEQDGCAVTQPSCRKTILTFMMVQNVSLLNAGECISVF